MNACRAARSGLEAIGTGGGTPSIAGTELGRSAGTLGSCLGCDGLPKPIVSADFLGGGGACTLLAGSSSCASSDTGVACSCLTLVLAGSVGLPGTWGLLGTLGALVFLNALVRELEVDFPGRMELYFCSCAWTSSFVRFGGRGGKAAGLNSGARTAYLSDREVIDVPLDLMDTDECVVAIELTESFEAFRLRVISDGRLGGSAGEVAVGVRAGSGGPSDDWEDCVGVLAGRAGLEIPSMPFADALSGWNSLGWLPIPPLPT